MARLDPSDEKRRRGKRGGPAVRAVHPRWHQLSGEDMAHEVCAIVDGLGEDQKPRANRYLMLTSLYEMRPLNAMTAAAYDTSDKYYEDLYIPLARNLCDTVQADIAGRQRVKAQFSTTGADWRTRRRGKKLDQFVLACMHAEQGTYGNGWELCDDVFLDETICGHGVTKVYVDDSLGDAKVVIERRRPGSLKVDAREAENGDPLNFFDDYMVDEDVLIARYVDAENLMVRDVDDEGNAKGWRAITEEERDQRRWAIHDAAMQDASVTVESYGTTRIARSVKVREAWRMPISKDITGKHAICIPKCVLDEDDWSRAPATVWRWSRERCGYWGTSLIEETKQVVAEFNRAMERMQERMVLCANKRTFYRPGSIDEADLEKNESENFIAVQAGHEYPQEQLTPPFTPQELEYIQLVRQFAFESGGVSQMSATSRKDPGVTAAVAMRTMIDVASKRLVVKARNGFEFPFVQMAKQIVLACAEYVEATGKDIIVALPGKRGSKEIKWSQASLDVKNLVVQIQPGSALPDDDAGRKQSIAEAFQMGIISPTTYKRLLDWSDLQAEVDRENAEYEYLESLLERYLDAEEETEYQYDPPDGYILDKGAAMVQFAQAYFVAKREGAPEFNLQILRRYMLQLGDAIERAQQSPEQAGAAPPGPEAQIPPGAGPGLGAAPLAPAA